MVVYVLAEEDVGEGAMVIAYMNLPAGTENLWQRPVYTLKTNGYHFTCNKRIIFKK